MNIGYFPLKFIHCFECCMLAKTLFKKSVLSLSLGSFFDWNQPQKRLCLSLFLTLLAQQTYANNTPKFDPMTSVNGQAVQADPSELRQIAQQNSKKINEKEDDFNSYVMLQQQEQYPSHFTELNQIDLKDLPLIENGQISSSLEAEIMQVAKQAQQEAQLQRSQQDRGVVVNDASVQELSEINQAPINVDTLMNTIQANSQIVVQSSDLGKIPGETEKPWAIQQPTEERGVFKRLWYKVRPPRQIMTAKTPKISVDVQIVNAANSGSISDQQYQEAITNLKNNIKAQLSSFTQESFADYNAALPQLRTLSRQAAQAVGFYQAEFYFKQVGENRLHLDVTPNNPVVVVAQNIEFTGEGQDNPRFQLIKVLPELTDGDVFNSGAYQTTKDKIDNAATDNGFFDSYWRLHDVKIMQPENTADINLRYETGERYKLGEVEFRMTDPSKPFPLNEKILKSLVPWEPGADYTFWRVNTLANNLTNTRYFNYTLVDAIKPEPIIKPLENAPDIQKLIDENNIDDVAQAENAVTLSDEPVEQTSVDEDQFVGVDEQGDLQANARMRLQLTEERQEEERLEIQARETKVIPVIVELNADKLNSAEVGLGFGTDTGPRLRSQYRRAIVNKRGHSFDANMEVSQIRQAIDGHYNIPYKHPINDYIAIVGGYEREERKDVADGEGLSFESAVLGIDRIIKRPLGSWQHTYGIRYRLDQIDVDDGADPNDFPEAFLGGASEQQESLLLGYEAARLDSDHRINPTKGVRQRYKIEIGSDALFTDVNLAIVNAAWGALYSFGENNNYQVIGKATLGYIFTNDFDKVPYNLRYFTGGDQTIRGFDYKSLSPEIDDYKVGGQALGIASLEYNYQFIEGWRAAVFTDAGNAYDKNFSNPTEYSLGVGLRWASPIGSIRVDLASGISDPGKPIRIHFFIGPQL